MRLFTYIVVSDKGFSPNPFHGWCTLACCKPRIRSSATAGDLVVGISPGHLGHRIVYGMVVTEAPLTFKEYYQDSRFHSKKPRRTGDPVDRRGDNIYKPLPGGSYRQLPSFHSRTDGCEHKQNKKRDLSGKRVLISEQFWYFGRSGKPLPPLLSEVIPGRGHRCRFPDETVHAMLTFLKRHKTGVRGLPTTFSDDKARQADECGPCGGTCER